MDLKRTLDVVWKHRVIVLIGIVIGGALAFLSLFAVDVGRNAADMSIARRSHTTYKATTSLLIDTPGFGAGRADVAMDKPAVMAPTFAYMAMGDEVLARVKKELGGDIKATVTAGEVPRSPVLQIVVEGDDAGYVAKVADTVAAALVEYVTDQQEANEVPVSERLRISVLGAPPPETVMSRDAEIAGLFLVIPVLVAVGIAFAVENISASESVGPTVSTSPHETREQPGDTHFVAHEGGR
jgi:capsular polysaccharide biosynthesis protein